jgi:hypothetical protein
MRQRTQTVLFVLVLLLGLSPSSSLWAGDAELFEGLIPGTPLTDEELDQCHGRGVGLARILTARTEELTEIGEFVRERFAERLHEGRIELLHETSQSFSTESQGTSGFSMAAESTRIHTDTFRDRTQATFRSNP